MINRYNGSLQGLLRELHLIEIFAGVKKNVNIVWLIHDCLGNYIVKPLI